MDISCKSILKILNKNFDYPIIKTVLGDAIEMNCYDAFLFSNVTGAGYLDSTCFPFSPKGCMKILFGAYSHKFVTGIFDNLSLKYTPYYLSLSKPYLFVGTKKIIPVNFIKEKDYFNYLQTAENIIIANKEKPTDYLFLRVEMQKKGNGMEPFMEYITCEWFKRKGYVVENQVPLAHTVGSPDFCGYTGISIPSFLGKNLGGCHIIELAMLRLFNNSVLPNTLDNSFIVGEAKTSTMQMLSQLMKYWDTGLYDEGYEIHPSKKQSTENKFGMIHIDDDYSIVVNMPETFPESKKTFDKKAYCNWLNIYMKLYLLANLTNDELNAFVYKVSSHPFTSYEQLISVIEKTSIEEIMNQFKEN